MNEMRCDFREHDSRSRWAETCGARVENPSSNLCLLKHGEATRADVRKPRVGGRMAIRSQLADVTQNECAHALPRSLGRQEQFLWRREKIEDAPKLMTLSESEQYLTTSSTRSATEASRMSRSSPTLTGRSRFTHTSKTSHDVQRRMVEPELQNDSQAADSATMIDENLDHERKGSGKYQSHFTRC